MKFLAFLSGILFCLSTVYGQSPTIDSVGYQLARQRLSDKVDERNALINEYTQSLTTRTGIFHSRSQNDNLNSDQLLIKVVEADTQLLNGLKTFLGYTFTQQQQSKKAVTDERSDNDNLSLTVKKLQQEAIDEKQFELKIEILTGVLGVIAIVFFFLLRRKNKLMKWKAI